MRDYGLVIQAAPMAIGLMYRQHEADGGRLRVGEFCDCRIEQID